MKTPICIAMISVGTLALVTGCEQKNEPTPPVSTATPTTTAPASAADNTARNKGDGSSVVKTPLDQGQAAAEVKITADIRRAIMDDKGMSTNAQNCKIITEKTGVVTLRGVVNSQAEKDSIESKAKAVAGVTRVDNQLEIKTN